jgi:hypothetical protein
MDARMPSQNTKAPPATPSQQKVEQRTAQTLIERTADQQTFRTGIFPAPRFLRRLARAR